MKHYIRYILAHIAWPTLLITASLTSIIWLTRALRYIDFIVNRGLSIGDFMYITALLVPSLLMTLLPISLFIAVLFAYNKLTVDSELVVMSSAGISRVQLAFPTMIFSSFIMGIVFLVSLEVLPAANRSFQDMKVFIQNNYASILLQEEVFNNPADGLTVFVRERDEKGNLGGILVHDSRSGTQLTLMAETGQLANTPDGPRFFLQGGLRQEMRNKKISWLRFDEYTLDIALYTSGKVQRKLGADEMGVMQLFRAAKDISSNHSDKDRTEFLAEAHKRLSWPLYCMGVSLISLAFLLNGQHQRRGKWKQICAASSVIAGSLALSITSNNMIQKNLELAPVAYAIPLLLATIGLAMLIIRRNTYSIAK
jgi:lipopolysaccharide export system permease protein